MTLAKQEALKVGPLRVAPHIRDGAPSGRWMIDMPPHVSPSGKRERKFFDTKTEAVAEARRLLREFHLNGAIRGHGPRLTGVTFSELSERWLTGQADCVATNKKRAISLKTHAHRLKALLAHFGAQDIASIAPADVVSYQKFRLAAKKASPTVNSETRLLRQIMTWAADHDLVAKVVKIEPIPEPKKRLTVPTTGEVRSVIHALPPRLALLVRFLAETGCRKGEAFALEWSDIDHANALVMIRRKDGWTPKTEHSDRDIPLTNSLLRALLDARPDNEMHSREQRSSSPSGLVFPGKSGGRMWNFEKALATAIKKAGVVRDGQPMHINPHLFRKAHATWQKDRGVDDSVLQPLLGRAPGSRVTAQNYVHLPNNALRTAVFDLDEERHRKANGRRPVPDRTDSDTPVLATSGNDG